MTPSDGTNGDYLVTTIDGDEASLDGGPSWSPDGEFLIYSQNFNTGGSQIYVIRADGSEPPVNLTIPGVGTNTFESLPDWSSSGRIIYRYNEVGPGFDPNIREIRSAVVNDPSDPTAFTDIQTHYVLPPSDGFEFLSWSPDSSKVLVQANGELSKLDISAETVAPFDVDLFVAGRMSWSPDGQQICYTGVEDAFPNDTSLRVLNADGTGEHQITFGGDPDDDLDFGCDWGVEVPEPYVPDELAGIRQAYQESVLRKEQEEVAALANSPDPVNMMFGNFYDAATDLRMWGPGMSVEMTRSYNTMVPRDGILGFGWSLAYDLSITETASDTVEVRRGNGRTDSYDEQLDGSLVGAPGSVEFLTKNPNGTYDLVGEDHLTRHFDATGKLLTIADLNGNTMTHTYTGDLWTGLEDTAGRNWTLQYNVDDRVEKIIDPALRFVEYGYDGAGNLVTATSVGGHDTTYTYDADHRMLNATDANGNSIITNIYTNGLVTEQHDERGTHKFKYVEGKTTFTDPENFIWTTEYDPDTYQLTARRDPSGAEWGFTYNGDGLVSVRTDPKGNETLFTYDARHNIATITDRVDEVTTQVHDGQDNLVSFTDPGGNETTFTYDGDRNLTSRTDPLDNTTEFTHDNRGLVETITDPLDHVTTFDHNSLGQVTSITDDDNNTTEFDYDVAGRRTTVTDPLDRDTTTVYDAANNVTSVTDPSGATAEATYDAVGNVLTETDPLDQVTNYTYNDANDLVTTEHPDGTTYTSTFDKLGRTKSTADPDGDATTFTYDGRGLLTKVRSPIGHETEYTYDENGNRSSETDALNRTTLFGYDAEDRMTSVTDPLGGVTTNVYDESGNRTSTTDPKTNATTLAYDELNRVTTVTDAANRVRSMTYTDNGMLATATNPANQVVSYTYDNLDRLTGVAAFGVDPMSYAYDAVSRRTSMTDDRGTTNYDYDDADRLISVDGPAAGLGDEVSYGYDDAGQRTQMTQPGRIVDYTYDAAGRATGVEINTDASVDYVYDADGRPQTATFGDGTVETFTYDDDGRLTLKKTMLGTKLLESFGYTYDAIGNKIREKTRKTQTDHVYDALNRLTTSTYKAGKKKIKSTFAYDAAGNTTLAKVGKAKAAYTYDAANMPLTLNGKPFTNDAAGRRTASKGVTYAYNGLDQLTSMTIGTTTTSFTYDGDGNRVGHNVGTTDTPYLLDVAKPLPERIAQGAVPFTYGFGLIAEGTGTGFRYDHTDALGTVRFQTASAKLTNPSRYAPFGKRLSGTGTMGFTGEPQAGSLVHLRARDYDAATGRFLTADQWMGDAAAPQSLNRYSYTANNPVNFTDPSGMNVVKEGWDSFVGWLKGLFGGDGSKPPSQERKKSQNQGAKLNAPGGAAAKEAALKKLAGMGTLAGSIVGPGTGRLGPARGGIVGAGNMTAQRCSRDGRGGRRQPYGRGDGGRRGREPQDLGDGRRRRRELLLPGRRWRREHDLGAIGGIHGRRRRGEPHYPEHGRRGSRESPRC